MQKLPISAESSGCCGAVIVRNVLSLQHVGPGQYLWRGEPQVPVWVFEKSSLFTVIALNEKWMILWGGGAKQYLLFWNLHYVIMSFSHLKHTHCFFGLIMHVYRSPLELSKCLLVQNTAHCTKHHLLTQYFSQKLSMQPRSNSSAPHSKHFYENVLKCEYQK